MIEKYTTYQIMRLTLSMIYKEKCIALNDYIYREKAVKSMIKAST